MSCTSFFGRGHKYGKWLTKETGRIERASYVNGKAGQKMDIGSYLVQQRVCEICGFIQLNRQEEKIKN